MASPQRGGRGQEAPAPTPSRQGWEGGLPWSRVAPHLPPPVGGRSVSLTAEITTRRASAETRRETLPEITIGYRPSSPLHLRHRGLRLWQPERHFHGAVQLNSRR